MAKTTGNNNPAAWEEIEKSTRTIPINSYPEEFHEYEETENVENGEEIDADSATLDVEPDKEDYGDVLQLTQYNDSMLTERNIDYVAAEYNDINVVGITQKHQIAAKNFVGKITKFILDFNDVVLSEEHKKYIKQVGNLQLQHLEDLLVMVDINKQMLGNIVARVNASQAEDYAIIAAYTNLSNQHIKLIKELQNTYRSIPTVLKKMRADVLCNQELEEGANPGDEVITEGYGETQFSNTKQTLAKILADKQKADALKASGGQA